MTLQLRALSLNDDPHWLNLLQIGEEPWEREVEVFFRTEALIRQRRGDCNTTLFLLDNEDIIAGFMSVTADSLRADPDLKDLFGFSSRKTPRTPVGAAYLCAIGTDIRHRNKGYGTAMHTALIESLTLSMLSPRFVFLQVWEDSPAVRLYERWGYRILSTTGYTRDGVIVGKHKMVLDRFTAIAG